MRQAIVALVKGYQRWISPCLGDNCRFIPSCSEYAVQSIERYGILRGVPRSVARICRCHPWHPGGFDPVDGDSVNQK
jgi:uncharacterized protein